jgi:branched-chain amino acid transport system ATP-binding protein
MTAVLSVEDLSTRHGGGLKLGNVSLDVHQGELVCILGANGAGKTSLLSTIAGIYRPMLGRIRFLGRDIGGLASHKVAQGGLALAPQNHPVFESLTVLECLTLQGAKGIDDMFNMFPNLAAKRHQRAGRLSGGERQMLSMAQSLALHPKLCLLDEPSSGLAPMIVHEVFEAIRKLVTQGLTVLMVEQNATAALKLAHRAYVMEHGRITLEGSARSVAANDRVRKAYLGL